MVEECWIIQEILKEYEKKKKKKNLRWLEGGKHTVTWESREVKQHVKLRMFPL